MNDPGGSGPALPPQRAALVESLRERISRAEYRVPAEAVADALLRAWARGGPNLFGRSGGEDGWGAGGGGAAAEGGEQESTSP